MVSKNGNSFELRFDDKETTKMWIDVLKRVCVLTNFHEEYKAIKLIGKGTFAKVNICLKLNMSNLFI